MREEVHLTPDQAYEACVFMGFSEAETRYFLKLVEYERAANPRYRTRLKQELDQMRSEQEDLKNRFREEQVGQSQSEMLYYSSWLWSAIHILTDIPKYRTTRAMATRLGIDEAWARHCLQTLEKFGLVRHAAGDTWIHSSGWIHLPKQSPMISVHHANWRTRAVLSSQNPNHTNLHYTIVQSVSLDDFARIKTHLLAAIEDYRKIADASPEQELICFNCDAFVV
jgi:uncharacterized protein (TIGR02147 family)